MCPPFKDFAAQKWDISHFLQILGVFSNVYEKLPIEKGRVIW